MTRALEDAKALLSEMSREEKARLLRLVAEDLGEGFPGIEYASGVCGGNAPIVRTRIPVWTLEQARRLGASEAQLLNSFPTLRGQDLAAAWAYVEAHRDEIDRQITENEAA